MTAFRTALTRAPARALAGVLTGALALLGLFVVVPSAWAHTELVSSSPASGQTLSAAPTQVTLTFGEAVSLPANPIAVSGPGGAAWTVGKATVRGGKVTAPVTASGPAGAYTLTWRATGEDGHTISGRINFKLAAPVAAPAAPVAAATPAPAAPAAAAAPAAPAAPVAPEAPAAAPIDPAVAPAAAESGSGVPGWVWIAVVAVVLGGAAALVAARKRGGA
jgi:copper resistance protein C